MSFSGQFCCSTLMISIVMKSKIVWYVYLYYISTMTLFPVYVVICNHLSASVITLLNALKCLRYVLFYFWGGGCGMQHDVQSGILIFVFGIFIMKSPKHFAGVFLFLRICTLHFTGMMYVPQEALNRSHPTLSMCPSGAEMK